MSEPISRVLYPFAWMTVIPLGRQSLNGSSNLPEGVWPGQSAFLFGLASDGACLARSVAASAGGLLPHRFTLTCLHRRSAFCCAFQRLLFPDVIWHLALRSPDFPPRAFAEA